jgi:hypothetical protein
MRVRPRRRSARRARAQDPPPPISPFVFDLRGSTRNFPDSPDLAASRGLSASELPGRGLGFDAAAHVHLFKWKAITFGVGGQFTIGRAHLDASDSAGVRAVTETLTSLNSDLSLNFGDGEGWSYLSAGPGFSIWELVGRRGRANRGRRGAIDDVQLRRRCAMVRPAPLRISLRCPLLQHQPRYGQRRVSRFSSFQSHRCRRRRVCKALALTPLRRSTHCFFPNIGSVSHV